MNNVICFSDNILDYGKEHRVQLREWITEYFKNKFIVLGHVSDHKYKSLLKETFSEAIVQVEPDVPIQKYNISPEKFKMGVQAYLQKIHALRKVNSLRTTFLSTRPSDRIMRCQFDILFNSDPQKVETIEDNEIGIPDCYHNGGYNNQMAIMGGDVATHYFNIFTTILQHRAKCVHPEYDLYNVLNAKNISVKMLDIQFNNAPKITCEHDPHDTVQFSQD